MVYNTQREVFPDTLFAAMMGFKEAELFEVVNDEVKERVKVSF
jgi:LemA protein